MFIPKTFISISVIYLHCKSEPDQQKLFGFFKSQTTVFLVFQKNSDVTTGKTLPPPADVIFFQKPLIKELYLQLA